MWYDKYIYVIRQKIHDTDSGVDVLPGWYFSDESYDVHGPFATRDEAVAGIINYNKEVLGS